MQIDLNSDMGEGFGPYQLCDDAALMNVVSSANIACGFHAGDPVTMTRMVRLAKASGVGIGAHPGLPDRLGFGRREMQIDTDEMRQIMLYQLGALYAIAGAEDDVGARIHCVFTELTETSFMSCAFDLWDRAHAIQTQRCSPSPNTVAEVQS